MKHRFKALEKRSKLLLRSHVAARIRGWRYASMPTAMVTGTDGKTTTCRLLASILQAAGHTVGLATTDNVMVGDAIVRTGDSAGSRGHRFVFADRRTTAAVLETARGGLSKRGLYVRPVQACALLNVGNDHVGMDGIDDLEAMADLKRRVTDAARDRVVLYADDARTRALVERYGPRKVTLFSPDPASPHLAPHLARGGEVMTADATMQMVHVRQGAAPKPLVRIADIPVTLQGRARPFIANAMAAAALGLALGASERAIRDGLVGFMGGAEANPGRFTIYREAPVLVVGDHAMNPHGIAATAGILDGFEIHGKRLMCLSVAGNRPDAHFDAVGKVVADAYDTVIAFEMPEFRRGRQPGEIARLLKAAVLRAGMPSERVHAVDLRDDALSLAARIARPGDAVLIVDSGLDDAEAAERILAHDDTPELRSAKEGG